MKKNLIIAVLMPVLVVLSYLYTVGFQIEIRPLATLILMVGLMSMAIRRAAMTYQVMKNPDMLKQGLATSDALVYIEIGRAHV